MAKKSRRVPLGGGPTGDRMGGASPGSAQHLAARLAQARNKKSVKQLYGKALR